MANYKKMYLHSTSSTENAIEFLKHYLKNGDPGDLIEAIAILKNSQLVCEEIYLNSTDHENRFMSF